MYQAPRVKTILQSYGNQNNMVVAPTSDTQLNGMKLRAQKYTHTWTISMQQMSKKTQSGERMMFNICLIYAGKTGQNNEGRLLFYIIYKN